MDCEDKRRQQKCVQKTCKKLELKATKIQGKRRSNCLLWATAKAARTCAFSAASISTVESPSASCRQASPCRMLTSHSETGSDTMSPSPDSLMVRCKNVNGHASLSRPVFLWINNWCPHFFSPGHKECCKMARPGSFSSLHWS